MPEPDAASAFVSLSASGKNVIDGRDRLREAMYQDSDVVAAHADMLRKYLEIDDDAGVIYSVQKMTAHMRVIIDAASELKKANAALEEIKRKKIAVVKGSIT